MAAARKVTQLVVITPNEVGTLERICAAVREVDGGLLHVCASTLGEEARFMLAVKETDKVRSALEALEYEVSSTQVLEVRVDNAEGVLEPIAARLSEADVDIEFLYATSADGDVASCIMATNDDDRALEVISWV